MRSYSIIQIARICGGAAFGKDTVADTVMTDSRHSFGLDDKPLFVAISGRNHDGHDYVDEMYRRGVRAFLVERIPDDVGLFPEAGFVLAPSTLKALQALAADSRSKYDGIMIAVTGSSGKTIVKEWLARMIPDSVSVFRSPRSYNSQLGVPLSILMMQGDEDVALLEVGISRPGEMESLQRIVKPDIGVFTNIGVEHRENFISESEQIRQKALLFSSCSTVVYNAEYSQIGDILRQMYPEIRVIACPVFESLKAIFTDEQSRENASLVAAAAALLSDKTIWENISGNDIDTERLLAAQPDSMRMDIREGIANSIIVSDGNNTDVNSIAIATDYLRTVSGERPKIMILTDVLFTGMAEDKLYSRVAHAVEGAGLEYIIGVGEHICKNKNAFRGMRGEFYPTTDDMLRNLNQSKISGRAVLVKGNQSPDFRLILHSLQRRSHTTVLEINLDAMQHNLNVYRGLLNPQVKLMAMVKASGYGNGNYEVASMLQSQGVDYLAVAFADEGVRLREQGITMPIVVLNADSDSFDLMVANRLEPEIYNFISLRMFVRAVKHASESSYPIHVKFDTGMHRLGFDPEETDGLIVELLRERETVVVRSVFSHLAAADCDSENSFTHRQIEVFNGICEKIALRLGYRPLRHILNSAGIENFPQAQYDMCRLGIGLYGCSTSDNMKKELKYVSRLTTRIVQIREVLAGQSIGYGRAQVLERDTRIATIPVGYADGLDRRLGCGAWSMMAAGKTVPTVGRICMDSCMIDVTGIDISEGDEVVVFGEERGNTIDDMARVLGTIPYEIMTSISDRVKRIFIRE